MGNQTIFISSPVWDEHGDLVAACCKALGESVIRFDNERCNLYDITIDYGESDPSILLGEHQFLLSQVKSVWNRRIGADHVFRFETDKEDRRFCLETAREFDHAFASLTSDAFAVNPLGPTRGSAGKARQIAVALSLGFRVPGSLITNSATQLKEFRNKFVAVCVKPFVQYTWDGEDTKLAGYTAILPEGPLDESEISLIPSIYQEYIPKACEVRLTIFGNYHVATRIDSQAVESSAVDFRGSLSYLKNLSPYEMPDEIIRKSKALLSRLHLRFGTIDFAVTPDGDYVFFEINQAGQFLWQEMFCPDVVILEPFCRYLATASDDFTFDPLTKSKELSLSAFIKSQDG